jgi:hypothetical protein
MRGSNPFYATELSAMPTRPDYAPRINDFYLCSKKCDPFIFAAMFVQKPPAPFDFLR